MKETRSITYDVRQPIKSAVTNQARSANAPPIQHRTLVQHQHHLDHGLINTHRESSMTTWTTPPPAPSPTLPAADCDSVAMAASATSGRVTSQPQASSPHVPLSASTLADMALEFSQRQVQDAKNATIVASKEPRKLRTCGKCGDSGEVGCPGRQRVNNCRRYCQDCGKVDCHGRDMTRAHIPCTDPRVKLKMIKKQTENASKAVK